jgi:hypothetical protein
MQKLGVINHDNNLDNLVMENKYYLKGDQIQFFYIGQVDLVDKIN